MWFVTFFVTVNCHLNNVILNIIKISRLKTEIIKKFSVDGRGLKPRSSKRNYEMHPTVRKHYYMKELNVFRKMKTPVYIFGWDHVLFLLFSRAWHDYFENSHGRIWSEEIKTGERCHTMGQVSKRMKLVILLARARDTSFVPSTCFSSFLHPLELTPWKGERRPPFSVSCLATS